MQRERICRNEMLGLLAHSSIEVEPLVNLATLLSALPLPHPTGANPTGTHSTIPRSSLIFAQLFLQSLNDHLFSTLLFHLFRESMQPQC
jgi:hypothetical protein